MKSDMNNLCLDRFRFSRKYSGDDLDEVDIYRRATENGNTCQKRLDLLNEKFLDMCEKNKIDIGYRNVAFTESERREAMLENVQFNGGKCPLPHCGRILNNDNCEIDHVNPKSKSGVLIPVAICNECNRKKGNWTAEELQVYSDYVSIFSR